MLSLEQAEFVSKNHNLIYSFLSKYKLNIDEYYDVAAIGLCKAAEAYNSERKSSFSNYAYIVMYNEIKQEWRNKNKHSGVLLYDDFLSSDSEDTLTFLDTLIGEKKMAEKVISILRVSDKLEYLSITELKALASKLGGKTQRQIADELGFTQSYISRIVSNASKFILSDAEVDKIHRDRINDPSYKNQMELRKTLIETIIKLLDHDTAAKLQTKTRIRKQKETNITDNKTKKTANKVVDKQKNDLITTSTEPKIEVKQEKTVVYAGSFDPITLGHLDIIKRASLLFDKVIIAIGVNSSKKYTFTLEERTNMIKLACKDIHNIEVDNFEGLIAEYVKRKGAIGVVKGLRAVSDFDYEFQMSLTNKSINKEFETILLPSNLEYMYLSSSVVREVGLLGGDISQYISPEILDIVLSKLRRH